MKTNKIKKMALDVLTDNWGQALVVIFVLILIHAIFSFAEMSMNNVLSYYGFVSDDDFILWSQNKYLIMVSAVRAVLELIFICPIYMGAVWWYIHYVRGENNSVTSVFVCYSNGMIFFKSIVVKLLVFLIKLTVMIPICVCIYAQYKLIDYSLKRGVNDSVFILLAICCAIFTACLICFYVLFSLRYALVDYCFVLNPDTKISEIMKFSVKKMKNKKIQLIKIAVSFLWYIPACLFIFPLLFVLPYYAMSFSLVINNIMDDNYGARRGALVDRGTVTTS